MRSRYQLIVTDLDGTLLNDRSEVTRRTRAAIEAARRRGIKVVLNTARPPRWIRSLHRDLNLSEPVITYNGALIYDFQQDRTVLHRPIPREIARRTLRAIRSVDSALNVGMELADEWHVDRIDPRLQADLDAFRLAMAPLVSDLDAVIATTTRGISKLYVVGTASQREAIKARIARDGPSAPVEFTSSGADFLEISAAGVDKGTALRALARHLDVPLERVIALGDGENDVSALRVAGLGIAMGHADGSVRRAADLVTGSNTNDGWADAIERYALIEEPPV